jgi:hypothetical protein
MLFPLLLASAHAACGPEVAALTVGDRAWAIEPSTWEEQTATLHFQGGYAFGLEDADGQLVGVVAVGALRQVTHAGKAGPTVAAALQRELSLSPDIDDTGDWVLNGDVAIGLGAAWVPARTANWTPVQADDNVVFDLGDKAEPTVLVAAFRDLEQARSQARRVVQARALDLADSGYPLATMLAADAGAAWRFTDLRAEVSLGGLAGQLSQAADPWLTTLAADPMLPSGTRAATLVPGSRHTDRFSGT